jgi:hypothetical protein
VECLAAVAGTGRLGMQACALLSQLPGFDWNIRLPHGVNGFPDIPFDVRANYLVIGDASDSARRRPREGIPPIFSLMPEAVLELSSLGSPQVDVDRRGKHGETILFPLINDKECVRRLHRIACMDRNATDRHGNTAVGCAVLSRGLQDIRYPMKVCWSEFLVENESGDSALELTKMRAKRSVGSGQRPRDVRH